VADGKTAQNDLMSRTLGNLEMHGGIRQLAGHSSAHSALAAFALTAKLPAAGPTRHSRTMKTAARVLLAAVALALVLQPAFAGRPVTTTSGARAGMIRTHL